MAQGFFGEEVAADLKSFLPLAESLGSCCFYLPSWGALYAKILAALTEPQTPLQVYKAKYIPFRTLTKSPENGLSAPDVAPGVQSPVASEFMELVVAQMRTRVECKGTCCQA